MWHKLRLLLLMVTTIVLVATLVKADDGEDDDGMSLDDLVQLLESFASSCDPVPEKEHIEEMILNKKDAQKGTKCFRYCLMQQFDLVEEGSNQMVKDKTREMMEMAVPKNEDAMDEIIDKCNQKNAALTDNCEAAHEHAFCILDEFKERGFKVPEVKQ